jgi:hypothetical protein
LLATFNNHDNLLEKNLNGKEQKRLQSNRNLDVSGDSDDFVAYHCFLLIRD